MYIIDFEQNKSIYEILEIQRSVTFEQLRKASQRYAGRLQKAVNTEGDKEAERKLTEFNTVKDKVLRPGGRVQYDESLGDLPSFEFADPVPNQFSSRPALLRVFRDQVLRDDVREQTATVALPQHQPPTLLRALAAVRHVRSP